MSGLGVSIGKIGQALHLPCKKRPDSGVNELKKSSIFNALHREGCPE